MRSFYQVELDEHADMSILIVTLAWNDSGFCTIEQAIHCYESVLCQVRGVYLELLIF